MTVHTRLLAPALAAAACSALLVSGCSTPQTVTENTGEGEQTTDTSTTGATEAPPVQAKATLEKAGFGGQGDYGWASAIVTNTSPDNVGMFVTVHFNLLDSKGDLVVSADQVEVFTSTKQTLALGTQVDIAGKKKVAKVEATLGLDNKTEMEDQPSLPVGKVKLKKDYGTYNAIFEVKNPGTAAQKSPRIGIVCFNESGKIIGGGSDYPELIPAKGRALVQAMLTTSGKPDSCDAYAAPATF